MSLLGQFISDINIQGERYVFKHSGTITQGAVMTLVFKKADSNKGIVLNISSREDNKDIMLHGSAVRSPAEQLQRDAVPDMRALGITAIDMVNIEVDFQAKKFHNYIGSSDSFIKISKGINVQDNNIKKYKGIFKKVECIAVRNFIEALDKQNADDRAGYETDIDDVLEPPAKRVKQENQKYHSSLSELFSTRLSTVKDLINSESDIQAIIQGLFTGQTYNDQRIQVFSEVSSGSYRIDIALIFQGSDDGVVHDPVIFELKYITRLKDVSRQYENAVQSSISQLSEYVQTFKSATDSKSSMCVSLVFNKSSTSEKYVTIHTSIEAVPHTSSSTDAGGKLSHIGHYKQEPKILQLSELLSDNENKPIPESLDLSDCYLNDESYEKLIVFLSKPSSSVREVNLSNSGINDQRMQKFAEMLKRNTFINKINLSKNQITDVGVMHIVDAMVAKENLPHTTYDISYHGTGCITSLDLSDNRINNKVADYLENGLKQLDVLEELKLARTDIKSDGIKSIVEGIQKNYMLQVLDLSGLGDIHLEENTIKMLFANKLSLRLIELSGSNMNLGEINAIIRAAKLTSENGNLESISLSGPKDIQQGESIDSNSLLDLMNNHKKIKKFALTNAGIMP
ncbi:hypothetical protein ALC60_00974 [Trachymyrmex zeteki]|uniref:Protein NLRC3 n=1 Tax=Mycetomoellerius zeteki TaxID=64791 RepID=A0A151XHX4_9HYME|nr:hypothetical protein ALC60_00974 [Trachymyrmex zeteki]